MSSGGGVLNPLNDISNIFEGTKNLFVNPAKQFNKYIEPAALEALPAAIAIGGTIASGGLLAPAALPFLVGGATTYGTQLATEGAGKMFSGTPPSIGDFAAGAAAGGLTFGAQAALGALSAPSVASTAASTTPNYLTMSASQLANSVVPTATASSPSLFGTIGSALGTGFTDVSGALGTTGQILQVAGTAMSAYSMIKGQNTQGQCNNVQSLGQQFSSNASSFDNTYQAITASNVQQSLSTMKSLYSQETSLANQISSSGSSCVSSTVISQIQQTLSSMQTYIQNIETYLGQSSSSTSSTSSSSTASTSSACITAQQNFTNLTSQFTNAYSSVTTNTASGVLPELKSYYSEAVNAGNEIVSACGNNSTITSTIQSYLNAMATDIQNLQTAATTATSSSYNPISNLTSGSIFNPTSAYAGTLPATSAPGATQAMAANSAANTSKWESMAIIGGGIAVVGLITWELTKGVA